MAAAASQGTDAVEAFDRGRESRVSDRRKWHYRRFLGRAGPPGTLLDVGCGYGHFVQLAQKAGWRAIGVDLDPGAVRYALDRLAVTALHGDLRGLGFPAGFFDVVTLWNSLECVAEPLDLLQEVHRVLRIGGRVFIRTQNAQWHRASCRLTGLLRRLWPGPIDRHPYLTYIFNQNSFCRATLTLICERAGFSSIQVKNSRPTQGDPYIGVGPGSELLFSLTKQTVHAGAQVVSFVSARRLLIGSSLEASARRLA